MAALAAFALAGCSQRHDHGPLTAQQQSGQEIFQANCAVCHFADSNRPRGGPGLQDLFQKKFLPSGAPANDERVRQTITMGRGNMPHFDQILDDQQMNDLLAYLHTL